MTASSVTKFRKQFKLSPQTIDWLQKQPDAARAIEQLVAKAEVEEQNALIVASGRSLAEEELEISYEQIATLKQQLKHQQMEIQEYLQEIEYSKQELQECNRETIALQQKLLDLNSNNMNNRVRYRLACKRDDI